MDSLITNDQQWAALEMFKDRVEDLPQDKFTLARFLVAREFNIGNAEELLRKNLIWRKENKIEDLISEFPCGSEMRRLFPYEITGFDYEGSTIAFVPWKKWDARSWINNGGGDELFRWGICTMEITLTSINNTNAPNGKQRMNLIYDAEDLSYAQATHVQSLKLLFKLYQVLEQNYPETLKSITVINAPWISQVPYNFVKCIIPNRTMSKLRIFDSNKNIWLKHLLEIAPRESLPSNLF